MTVHNFCAHISIERIEHVPIFKKHKRPFWSPPSILNKCFDNEIPEKQILAHIFEIAILVPELHINWKSVK